MDDLSAYIDETDDSEDISDSLPDVVEHDDLPETPVDWPQFDQPETPSYAPPDLLPDLPESDEDFTIHPNSGPEFPDNLEGEPLVEGRPPDRIPQSPEGTSRGGPERGF